MALDKETGVTRRQGVIKALNECLAATELVCLLRYKRHHFIANGLEMPKNAEEFLRYEDEEADSSDLEAMVRVSRIAERVVAQSYGQIIGLLGDRDPVTRHLPEDILTDQQVHAEELQERLID